MVSVTNTPKPCQLLGIFRPLPSVKLNNEMVMPEVLREDDIIVMMAPVNMNI